MQNTRSELLEHTILKLKPVGNQRIPINHSQLRKVRICSTLVIVLIRVLQKPHKNFILIGSMPTFFPVVILCQNLSEKNFSKIE